ncbi:guanylate cyclase [Marinilabiliaceae bacterium JC017]|nr:guanylate cyclase [Marinilabiliaceae bacterium JC017]
MSDKLPGFSVQEKGRIRSRKYRKVTVLFADIQGFTRIVEHLNPESLIDELDRFFFQFDEVVEKYGIEKIKTIGDAYMCAGGIPEENRTNPVEVVLAAIEMQTYMKKMQKQRINEGFGFWELRIGVHTGPVISGVIGQKKLSFDIWGDTVNIASRMESSGIAGEINITGITYHLIKELFNCEYRGKMPIKYKGETDMYFVKGILPELSEKGEGQKPNGDFFLKLQHIRFSDLEEFILARMEKELSENLCYHDVNHTVDVVTRVELLGRAENISSEDLLIIKTAALFHDAGFIIAYENHEDNGIRLAKEILPRYHYSLFQIDQVVEIINVTKFGAHPRNFLERIMKDADLDYIGRTDFVPVSNNRYREINALGYRLSLKDWNEKQIQFISNHDYYTQTARELRQVNKERQLQKLKELLVV